MTYVPGRGVRVAVAAAAVPVQGREVRDAPLEHLEVRAGPPTHWADDQTRSGPEEMRISRAFGPTSNVQARRPVFTTLSPNLGCCLPVNTVPVGVMPRTTSPRVALVAGALLLHGRGRRGRDRHGGGRRRGRPGGGTAAAGLTVAAALRTWAVDFLWSEPEQAHATRPMRVIPPART